MHEHQHHIHYHLLRMGEMGRVFWCHSLGSVAVALVGFFVPIYLLRNGYGFTEVLALLALWQVFAVALQIPAARLIARFGSHRAMALGSLSQIALFALLLTVQDVHWPIYLFSLAMAGSRTLYWVAFHTNFIKARAAEKTGQQVGLLMAIIALTGGVAPAIGGVIATTLGTSWVYGLAIVLLLSAIAPMWLGPGVLPPRPKMSKLPWRKVSRDVWSNFFDSFLAAADGTLWPLWVSLVVTSYAGIGGLTSVVTLAAVATSLYVGRRQIVKGERHYLKEGASMRGLIASVRAGAQSAPMIFGFNVLSGVGRSLYITPYISRYYANADRQPLLEYVTAMEMGNCMGGAVQFGILWALSFWLSMSAVLLIGLLMTLPASFGTRLIR